ncbi:MAG: hypothetical protein LUQ66_08775, partial [Methanoregula sp.]|nr:hypothetical protein [Methanoregula sp.]
VPLENTVSGYFSLPGLKAKEKRFRMIGADKCCTASEALEPDCIFVAVCAFLACGHGNRS